MFSKNQTWFMVISYVKPSRTEILAVCLATATARGRAATNSVAPSCHVTKGNTGIGHMGLLSLEMTSERTRQC